ncbi:hypothetical protein DL766_010445 [Monosporascus sp. MC13-8B]|uniref:Uncharacterized protein n=1 Tax=Monosporascus cannonballus TaxID=155416 RepID=A0ABY0GZ78_9PEZI|nr:hypothetical protein DL762_007415 [Monosporascus cannonballus]RYO84224.1 hypothetical protein DL763_007548 [Monosporascus cannonballus]RYP01799.1 hypothetical protein DL766_010445 [Monosporascus sp. MC13-8B]
MDDHHQDPKTQVASHYKWYEKAEADLHVHISLDGEFDGEEVKNWKAVHDVMSRDWPYSLDELKQRWHEVLFPDLLKARENAARYRKGPGDDFPRLVSFDNVHEDDNTHSLNAFALEVIKQAHDAARAKAPSPVKPLPPYDGPLLEPKVYDPIAPGKARDVPPLLPRGAAIHGQPKDNASTGTSNTPFKITQENNADARVIPLGANDFPHAIGNGHSGDGVNNFKHTVVKLAPADSSDHDFEVPVLKPLKGKRKFGRLPKAGPPDSVAVADMPGLPGDNNNQADWARIRSTLDAIEEGAEEQRPPLPTDVRGFNRTDLKGHPCQPAVHFGAHWIDDNYQDESYLPLKFWGDVGEVRRVLEEGDDANSELSTSTVVHLEGKSTAPPNIGVPREEIADDHRLTRECAGCRWECSDTEEVDEAAALDAIGSRAQKVLKVPKNEDAAYDIQLHKFVGASDSITGLLAAAEYVEQADTLRADFPVEDGYFTFEEYEPEDEGSGYEDAKKAEREKKKKRAHVNEVLRVAYKTFYEADSS